MSVELYGSKWVILPHVPNGKTVHRRRIWRTNIDDTAEGGEQRVALRLIPRLGLKFTVEPWNLEESRTLLARLDAVSRLGYAAVPFFGRGLRIGVATSGTTITLLQAKSWVFTSGDPILLRMPGPESFELWEIATVTGSTSTTLTISGALARSYPVGAFLWPLMLGKVNVGNSTLASNWHAPVELDFEAQVLPELVIPDLCAVTLGTYTFGGDTFDCYVDVSPAATGDLGAGNGWSGAWSLSDGATGIIAKDRFETYSLASPVTDPLSADSSWAGAWAFTKYTYGETASDDFESNGYAGGDGWAGDYVIT